MNLSFPDWKRAAVEGEKGSYARFAGLRARGVRFFGEGGLPCGEYRLIILLVVLKGFLLGGRWVYLRCCLCFCSSRFPGSHLSWRGCLNGSSIWVKFSSKEWFYSSGRCLSRPGSRVSIECRGWIRRCGGCRIRPVIVSIVGLPSIVIV